MFCLSESQSTFGLLTNVSRFIQFFFLGERGVEVGKIVCISIFTEQIIIFGPFQFKVKEKRVIKNLETYVSAFSFKSLK